MRDVRFVVRLFAEAMEKRLAQNDSKSGWEGCDVEYLLEALDEEVQELKNALITEKPKRILKEATDIANYAMMIADNAGGFQEVEDKVFRLFSNATIDQGRLIHAMIP